MSDASAGSERMLNFDSNAKCDCLHAGGEDGVNAKAYVVQRERVKDGCCDRIKDQWTPRAMCETGGSKIRRVIGTRHRQIRGLQLVKYPRSEAATKI